MLKVLTRREVGALVERLRTTLDQSDNPFATAEFTTLLLEQVAKDEWTFAAIESEDAVSLLYSVRERPGHWLSFTNFYASQFSPAAGRGRGHVLAASLTLARPAHSAQISPISESDAEVLARDFRSGGWYVRPYRCFGNWYLPCAGLSFDAYMADRPSQTLNTWRRRAKKFNAPGSEARLELVTDPSDCARAVAAYEHVYSRSWKTPEPFLGFVPAWAAKCAERGWLRLGLAWVGDVPVAAQFWFTRNGRAYIFKLAYDEAFSRYSAGTVLSAFMFQHALDVDRVEEIDYLTGDDPYKRAWMSHRRERVGVVACNLRTVQGAVRAAYEMAGLSRQHLSRWLGGTALPLDDAGARSATARRVTVSNESIQNP